MTETAVLGLEVRSDKVKQAAAELDKFSAAAKKSEKSTIEWADRVELASKKVEKASSQVNAITKPLDVLTEKAKEAARELDLVDIVVDEFTSGLMRTVGPAALAGAAFTAASAAAIAAWRAIVPEVKSVDDVLREHKKNIAGLKEAYGLAGDGAEEYSRRSTVALEAAERRSRAALRDALAAEEKSIRQRLSDFGFSGFGLAERFGLLGDSNLGAAPAKFAAFLEPIRQLRQEIKDGKPDYDAFQTWIEKIVATNPNKLRPLADELLGIIDTAAGGRRDLEGLSNALNGLTESQINTARIVSHLNGIEEAARTANQEAGALLRMLNGMGSPTMGSVGGPAAMDRAQAVFDEQFNLWRRFGYDNDSKVDPNKPKKTKVDRSAERDAKAYQQLIKSAEDRIKQMQQEIGFIGQLGAKTEAARYEMELISRATDRGRSISEKQRKEIHGLAEEYGRLKQVLAETKLQQDLLFERSQLFRTPTDQLIADTMRGAGLEVDFDSPIAGIIRMNEKIAETGELIRGVTMDLTNGLFRALEDGKITTEEWGEIAMSVLGRISEKLVQMATDQLTSSLLGWSFGGMGGGVGPFPGGGSLNSTGGLWANGGAFQGGNVIPFARGGIVSKPTLFPMANGAGLMGEAGPEAIMPLRRGADGRLGVSMHGAANQNYANQNQPAPYVDNRVYNFTGTSEEFQQFKEFVVQRDAEFDQRAVGAVKDYYGAGNSI